MVQPDILWVIADSTNAGKTTVSCALLRHLNSVGIRAVGFKPHGGLNLRKDYDFIAENYTHGPGKLYGKDAVQLAEASGIADLAMVEVIGPIYVLGHLGKPVLVRSGSIALGNREFFATSAFSALFKAGQIRSLEAILGFPIEDAPVLGLDKKVRLKIRDAFDDYKVRKSFDSLRSHDPKAFVIEGAGYYLPVWEGAPPATHIFYVYENKIVLFPNIDLTFSFSAWKKVYNFIGRRQPLPSTAQLRRLLVGRQRIQRDFELKHSDERDAYAQSLVADLLREGGVGFMVANAAETS
jgi:hypothetical protein